MVTPWGAVLPSDATASSLLETVLCTDDFIIIVIIINISTRVEFTLRRILGTFDLLEKSNLRS